MNVQAGLSRLRYAGGRATVREIAGWCDAPKDTSEAGVEGYSRRGLLVMMDELAALGAHQITPGVMDATVSIGPRPAIMPGDAAPRSQR